VFDHLQIVYPRDRALVGAVDLLLSPLAWRRPPTTAHVRRVLLLRLERIGDLLMVRDAIVDARAAWPDAEIDLVVGSWNAPLAALLPGVTRIETLDVPWLARGASGDTWPRLISRARSWKRPGYDVVVNFEPDIRTNALAWLSGARHRVGYRTGGGGAFLTDAQMYRPLEHVAVNARALVARAAGRAEPASGAPSRLAIDQAVRRRVGERLARAPRPLIGVHASGGRASKQWHLDRFAEAARILAGETQGTIVLTGGPSDRTLVDNVHSQIPDANVIEACGAMDLVELAALLESLDVFITGDTGPMHLAAAVGTPVVALFGPSDPRRYGPLGSGHHVLRVDLPCSPCNQVRLPPVRCRGHVPECLDRIDVTRVVTSAREALALSGSRDRSPAPSVRY
jgi:lipopolysaccharide heptosyltransferase II